MPLYAYTDCFSELWSGKKLNHDKVGFKSPFNIHEFIKAKCCQTNISLCRPLCTSLLIFLLPMRSFFNHKPWEPNKMPFFSRDLMSGEWWEMQFIFSCYVTDALSGFSCDPLSNNMFVFRVYICVANCYRWGKSCLTSQPVVMKTWALGDVQEMDCSFFLKDYVTHSSNLCLNRQSPVPYRDISLEALGNVLHYEKTHRCT